MAELLLELLSEEIPARMQARAADDLKRLVCDGLKAAGLAFTDARAFATPRRLALVVEGLPVARADVSEEKRGPRVGAPEQAIQGFLKAAGLGSLDQAEKRDNGKGEFWFAVIRKKGGPTADALPGVIEATMKALPWPKSMKWGSGTMQWVRPLHGIVALFDGKVLPGAIEPGGRMAPIVFGDRTRGHRFLSKGEIAVTGFADYVAKLRDAHVILDSFERQTIIMNGAERLCGEAQVRLFEDERLLEEVSGLVEWPVPLLGRIDEEFLVLPSEVLVSSMRTHQRYFSTWKDDLNLANHFVVVANNIGTDDGVAIVEGNERVLRARLSDAKFFWDQDRKIPLSMRTASLKDVVFHAKLGSQADRVQRIVELAIQIASFISGADVNHVRAAAELCKSDLVTGMVGEFPELQGVMGRYYALNQGCDLDIANAIGEHYSPAGPNDRCPIAPTSVAVALADKVDSLVGFWAIGEQPTGSRDPYALRRAALGCIRLIVESGVRIPLWGLLHDHFMRTVYSSWETIEKVVEYFNSDGRNLEEEKRVLSLIETAPWRSYLSAGDVLKRVVNLLAADETATMDKLRRTDILWDFLGRAEDILWSSDSPRIQRWTVEDLRSTDLSRREAAEEAAQSRVEHVTRIKEHVDQYVRTLLAFFAERLKVQMREKGVRHDVVDAVFAAGHEDDLVRLLARVEALQSFLATDAGKNLLTAYGRAANIVRAEEKKDKGLSAKLTGAPDAVLLEQVEEKAVASALADVERTVGPALAREDFAAAMTAFAGLRASVDAFFDKVTVNVLDKPELRLNRLKLLNQIRATMDSVADFSRIEG
jgi:glycyl-tRNA synthetase beta chain